MFKTKITKNFIEKVIEIETKIKKLKTRQYIKSVLQQIRPLTFESQVLWSMYKKQFKAKKITAKIKEKLTVFLWALRGPAFQLLKIISEQNQKNYNAVIDILK